MANKLQMKKKTWYPNIMKSVTNSEGRDYLPNMVKIKGLKQLLYMLQNDA